MGTLLLYNYTIFLYYLFSIAAILHSILVQEVTMVKRPKRYWVTYTWTFTWDIIVWIVVLLVRAIWGKKLHWLEGLWCEFKEKSWLAKHPFKNYGGITLGHGGLYREGFSGGPGIDTDTEHHEHKHVDQYESAMLRACLFGITLFTALALTGNIQIGAVLGYVIWTLGWVIHVLTNTIQAWIRGEDPYSGAVHEEAAYDEDKVRELTSRTETSHSDEGR